MQIGLGASCLEDNDCTINVENSQCIDSSNFQSNIESLSKTCQCRKGYVHFKDECLKEGLLKTIINSIQYETNYVY